MIEDGLRSEAFDLSVRELCLGILSMTQHLERLSIRMQRNHGESIRVAGKPYPGEDALHPLQLMKFVEWVEERNT